MIAQGRVCNELKICSLEGRGREENERQRERDRQGRQWGILRPCWSVSREDQRQGVCGRACVGCTALCSNVEGLLLVWLAPSFELGRHCRFIWDLRGDKWPCKPHMQN